MGLDYEFNKIKPPGLIMGLDIEECKEQYKKFYRKDDMEDVTITNIRDRIDHTIALVNVCSSALISFGLKQSSDVALVLSMQVSEALKKIEKDLQRL